MPGIHQGIRIGVCQNTKKNRQKNCGDNHRPTLFVPFDRIQIFFEQKELKIKISSLLNVSSANSKLDEFSLKVTEVLVDSEEQNWFKRAYVRTFLGLEDIRTSLNGLEKCEMLTRQELRRNLCCAPVCSGPEDQQNKTDKFVSVFGVMYTIVNSQKHKDKALKKHMVIEETSLGCC